MNVAIIGIGYVGLPTGVGFAELGHSVSCIDIDIEKIGKLQKGESTLYEDGLDALLKKNIESGRLNFYSNIEHGIENADIVIIAVGTPCDPITKNADLSYVFSVAKEISKHIHSYKVIAIKSTVPVGTGDKVENILKERVSKDLFDVVSFPEFLREGVALHDFFNPDRVVIGSNSIRASQIVRNLYKNFPKKVVIVDVDRRSSELIKYASNSFLAMKIHFINELADFCEQVGADILNVSKGIGLDSRIGNKFLNPGPGYGGSCFPKDTLAMSYMAHKYFVDMSLIEATIKGNQERLKKRAEKIINEIEKIEQKVIKVSFLGLAFKKGTDDVRDSPAISIIKYICNYNFNCKVNLYVYDPQAMDNAKAVLGNKVVYAKDLTDTLNSADCLVILTEWEEFRNISINQLSQLMRTRMIIDFRNLLDKKELRMNNFMYIGLGR